MKTACGAKSDRGLKRTGNEDQFYVDVRLDLYVVCDGMGGQNSGEVASQLAVDAIQKHCSEASKDQDLQMIGSYDPAFLPQTNRLASAIRYANSIIHREAQSEPCYLGMGTTVVSALLRGQILSVAHVGDSRLYLIRGDGVTPLTVDHSLVVEQFRGGLLTAEQAEHSPQKHILSRALGMEPTVEVELGEIPVISGDTLLLCSDGLTRMTQLQEILRAVHQAPDLQSASEHLIDMANAGGGEDNTTVVLISVQENPRRTLWQWIRDCVADNCDTVFTEKEGTSWRRM